MGMILSIWTVIVFVLFIGIVLWVWNSRNKDKYEEAANIPFNEEDDDEPVHKNDRENLKDG